MTFTHALSTNNYGPAKFIVDPSAANGTHTTIASAITSASSGDTIFIRPGTYTENLTLKAGVDLVAYQCDAFDSTTPQVIINGTCTMTTAGSVSISGICLQTNSAAALAITGSANSVVYLIGCYINCTNTTGITFSSSGASSQLRLYSCSGDIGTTGIALFSYSASGSMYIFYSHFTNSGSSSTASTSSGTQLTIRFCNMDHPLTSSSASIIQLYSTNFTQPGNTTSLTHGGTGANCVALNCNFSSGTASAISIGTGATISMSLCSVNSTNTNAITGAGTLNNYGIIFTNTSVKSNVTTQTGGAASGLSQGTAPSAGYIGEQIRSFINGASAITLTNATPANVTSISLTAGIWDVSGIVSFNGTITGTAYHASINTTSATEGSEGDNQVQTPTSPTAACDTSLSIPSYRLTLSSTTTVYLVVNCGFTAGTLKAFGRISGTRVG